MKYLKFFEDHDWTQRGDLPVEYLNDLFSFMDEYPTDRVVPYYNGKKYNFSIYLKNKVVKRTEYKFDITIYKNI